MSQDKPKGLPGFLRRSLRLNEEQEEESFADISDPSNAPERTRANNNGDAAEEQHLPPRPPARSKKTTPTGTPMSTPAPTPVLNKATRDQAPPVDIPTLSLEKASEITKDLPKDNNNRPKKNLQRAVSYKDRQLDSTILADVVNMADLRKLSWNGIPPEHRAQAWKIMLGYLPSNKSRRPITLQRKRAEYKDAIAQHYDIHDDTRTTQEQETLRQVLVDVPRTAPEVQLFRHDKIRKALSRLLYIWAMRHPASSYVQGINDLATPLIVVYLHDYFPEEESVLDGAVMDQVSDEVMDEVCGSSMYYFVSHRVCVACVRLYMKSNALY